MSNLLDEHAWPTQQARKVLENPHVADESHVTAVSITIVISLTDTDAAGQRFIPWYHPHVSIPMEASSGLSSRTCPLNSALVSGSWLAVPDCGIPVVFDAEKGL